MVSLQNINLLLNQNDMDDLNTSFDDKITRPTSSIHLRVQQRGGRKMLTIIEGLASDLDLKKIVKALKRTLKVNGAVIKTDDDTFIIQLTSDCRVAVKEFLVKYKIWEEPDEKIVVHGF